MRLLQWWPNRYVSVAATLVLAGCTVGPDFEIPGAPAVARYTTEPSLQATIKTAGRGGSTQSFAPGADIPGQWWTLFHSKQINAFIEEAIRNHPNLHAAQFALRAAREETLAEGGSLFPVVTGSGLATRGEVSAATAGTGPASLYNLYDASVSVSYSIDLFGGNRRQIEAAEAEADYQRFQLEASYLALTANVVTAAITDASLRAQIAATEDIIKAESDQRARVQRQFELGAVPQSDVLSQQSTLAQTQATLPPLQKQLAQQRDQLMAYLGRLPSEDRGESVDLSALNLPRKLPVSLPSSLLRQRPDIRAAEATLREGTANVGVAIADMLPQLTLSGSYGGSSLPLGKLLAADTIAWSVAAGVSQKIFDGGTLYHLKEASVASFEQDLAAYKSTVISAFQNVADALRAIQYDANTLKAEAAAEKAASDSLKISEEKYNVGATSFATVISAQQTYQNARILRVEAQAARFTDTVALFQALGGGWWNRLDETPDAAPRANPGYLAGPAYKVPATSSKL